MSSTRRSLLLHIYARLERPLLRLNYLLVRRRRLRVGPLRWLVGRLFLAPLARLGAAGQPLLPHETEELVRRAAVDGTLAIGPCGCRSTHQGCSHPIHTDIVIFAGVSAWQAAFPEDYLVATADEVSALTRRCRELNMIQVLYRAGMGTTQGYSICNCCTDGCLPLLNRRFYPAYRTDAGTHSACVDPQHCTSCALCVDLCPFEARGPMDSGLVRDCLGCGLCAERCPEGAVTMLPRTPSGQVLA